MTTAQTPVETKIRNTWPTLKQIRFALTFAYGQTEVPTDYDACVTRVAELTEQIRNGTKGGK